MDLAEKEFRVAWKLIVDGGMVPVQRKSERELFLQLKNGSYLECRTEENPDQLIGEGLDAVICAEAARLKHRTWDQYLRPALADRGGWALLTSTPRGFNWFYDFYNRGQSEEDRYKDWESWTIPSAMNPILPAAEIAEAKQNSSPEAFAQEWEAKFIAYGGLVFPEFDQTKHVRPHKFDENLETQLWIDPGSSAPYAVLLVQITGDEQVRVLDEIYLTGHTTAEIIHIAKLKWPQALFDSLGRPNPYLRVTIDRAAAEASATWRLQGFNAGGDKPLNIKKGIEVHHIFLKDEVILANGATTPRITWDPRCVNSIKEHGLYHYPDLARQRVEKSPTEVPVDVDNHTIDAIRYGYYNRFPELFNEERARVDIEYMEYDELIPDIRDRVDLGQDW
jgi:hypothetical protein